jgi:hypothetical protein
LGDLPIPRQSLEPLLPDGVPPGSEIQALSVNSSAPAHAQTVWPPSADRPACQVGTLAPAPCRGPSVPPHRAPPSVLIAVIGAQIDANNTLEYVILIFIFANPYKSI